MDQQLLLTFCNHFPTIPSSQFVGKSQNSVIFVISEARCLHLLQTFLYAGLREPQRSCRMRQRSGYREELQWLHSSGNQPGWENLDGDKWRSWRRIMLIVARGYHPGGVRSINSASVDRYYECHLFIRFPYLFSRLFSPGENCCWRMRGSLGRVLVKALIVSKISQ